jgi:hypothetical protein
MGCDKRKGKELMVEPPKKKKTHTQKVAECAAMATRATDDQVTGRGHQFQIREPEARTEEQQGKSVRLPINRFMSVRGLEEGTLSIKI